MPYTSSKRLEILNRIKSLLNNIKIINGFPINIITVSERILDIDNIHCEETPAIGISISSGGSNSLITTGTNIDTVLNIILNFFIYTQPEENPITELDKLLWSTEFALLNGTPNTPWNNKFKTASLNSLGNVYYVSFDEQFNTDEGILSMYKKAFARWSLTVKYLKSTTNP